MTCYEAIELETMMKRQNIIIGSVPLLHVHFSNNDFLGVRVSFFLHPGYTKGEVRVLWLEQGSGEMVLAKWDTTIIIR